MQAPKWPSCRLTKSKQGVPVLKLFYDNGADEIVCEIPLKHCRLTRDATDILVDIERLPTYEEQLFDKRLRKERDSR